MRKRPPIHIGKPLTAKQKITLKNRLFKEQGGDCALCRKPLTLSDSNLDHVRPLSKGGENHAINISLTHR